MNLLTPETGEGGTLVRPIDRSDYPRLFELDRAVYPTASPVTEDVVDQWYRRNREFGMIFPGEAPGSISGLFIVIPLSQEGWDNLITGKLTEAQMKDDMIFDPQRDTALGLHNYHIENLTGQQGFYKKALPALGNIVNALEPQVNLLGFSAYAVTNAGIRLHEKQFNMHEQGFFSKEYVIGDGEDLRVAELEPDEAGSIENKGVRVLRCKMLITTPGEKSIVWDYLKHK